MSMINLIPVLMIMLLVAALIEPVSDRLRIPFSVVLVAVGIAGGQIVELIGYDTGLHWEAVPDLVFLVLLPVLIFESAMNMNARSLWRNVVPIVLLAVPLMAVAAAIAAALIYFGIGHPTGFPVIAALLAAAVLAATDPAAVLALFKKIGVPERLGTLIDGESLFNDATAVVFFMLVLEIAINDRVTVAAGAVTVEFLTVFFGGLLAGIAVGAVCVLLLRLVRGKLTRSLVTVVAAYAAFIVAERYYHVSGVMSVLATGLVAGWGCRSVKGARDNPFIGELWEFNAYLANAVLFLLLGMTVVPEMFTEQYAAMLIGVGAVLIARAVTVFAGVPLISALPGVQPVGRKYQVVLFWGGIRGGVSVALVLSLPLTLPDWWFTVQSIAFGVVLFTLLVQAPTMPVLLRRLKL